MKNIFFPVLVVSTVLLIGAACNQQVKTTENNAQATTKERALRHVVLFKFKDGLPQDTIKAIETAFKGLKSQIPTIKDFEWGPNNSPENLTQGYTHCFIVTFASEKDRDDYLPHPAHQDFVNKFAKLYVDKVCVFDFWAEQ